MIIPNGTIETSDQNTDDSVPITNAVRVGVTRYAASGPSVNGNAIEISRESNRESAMAMATNRVIVRSVAVEYCIVAGTTSVGERWRSHGGRVGCCSRTGAAHSRTTLWVRRINHPRTLTKAVDADHSIPGALIDDETLATMHIILSESAYRERIQRRQLHQ